MKERERQTEQREGGREVQREKGGGGQKGIPNLW